MACFRPSKVKAKALTAAENAVEIDPTLAEAHTALGHVRATYCWDWPAARAEYQTAISLNPAYATVHHWYAITYLAPLGFWMRRSSEMEKAEELNPVSVSIKRDIAVILYTSRRYGEAVSQSKSAIHLDRGFHGAYWALGQAYEGLSMHAEAVAAFQKGSELSLIRLGCRQRSPMPTPPGASGKKRSQSCSDSTGSLSIATSRRSISRSLHLGLGNLDAFFEWLELAYRSRCYELVFTRVDPKFDPVRHDGRFIKMLRRLGLESCN